MGLGENKLPAQSHAADERQSQLPVDDHLQSLQSSLLVGVTPLSSHSYPSLPWCLEAPGSMGESQGSRL